MDKIYKILADMLDVKAGFPLANFLIRSDFFRSKTIKSRIGSYLFLLRKKSITNENSTKSRLWKTGLIGQANRSKVVYLSADLNAGPFKGLYVEYYVT